MNAASAGEVAKVRALIKSGANVNARSSLNATALYLACEKKDAPGARLEIVKMLVEAGADVSLKDGKGKTAMEIAAFGKSKTRSNAIFYTLADIEKYLTPIYGRDRTLYMAVGKLYSDNGNLNSSTRMAESPECSRGFARQND